MSQLESDGQITPPLDANTDTRGDETRPKKISCDLCRKRKLKCDGDRAGCSTCVKMSRPCIYNEVRRKSGPRRGYVKTLEARIAQMESKLKDANEPDSAMDVSNTPASFLQQSDVTQATMGNAYNSHQPFPGPLPVDPTFSDPSLLNPQYSTQSFTPVDSMPTTEPFFFDQLPLPSYDNAVIALGLEEAMPDRDVQDDLNRLFFQRIHPTMPVLHQTRYMASMHLAPAARPPVCLQYAMWALAALATDGYEEIHSHFYARARKYAERDEMNEDNHGFGIANVAHCQAWTFLSAYEFKMTYFPRAWLSIGRASRVATLISLNKPKAYPAPVMPTPSDWIEQEERRRTFWMCYVQDRYASSGPAWPTALHDDLIKIQLPCADDIYDSGLPMKTPTLEEVYSGTGVAGLSAFAGVVVTASFLGKNVALVNDAGPSPGAQRLDGEVWRKHRALDKAMLDFSMSLPSSLRLPGGMSDNNVILLNVTLLSATIGLHKSAVIRAEVNGVLASYSNQSKMRCIAAAQEIASIMRLLSHRDFRTASPFIFHNLAIAAGVVVQYLRVRPDDETAQDNLDFFVNFMQSLSTHSRLTDTFLVHLEDDIFRAGVRMPVGLQQRSSARARHIKQLKSDISELCPQNQNEACAHSSDYNLFGDGKPTATGTPSSAAGSEIPVRSRSGPGDRPGDDYRVTRIESQDNSVHSPTSFGQQTSSNQLHTTSSRVSTISSATPPASVNDSGHIPSPRIVDDGNMSGTSILNSMRPTDELLGKGIGIGMSNGTLNSEQLLNNMTDADWKVMMDVSMQDMGWGNGISPV